MAETNVSQEQRDEALLQKLGYKQELRRTLGFLSNFAVAFSYISVSTGTFSLFYARHPGGRSGFLLDMADRRHRAVHRRAELCRTRVPFPYRRFDLPMEQAALWAQSGLVYWMVLLLCRRPDHHRRCIHRSNSLDRHLPQYSC